MYHRKLTALLAGVFTLTSIAQMPLYGMTASAEDSYTMQVSVNLAGEQKSISPYIYGVNEYGNANNLRNITTHAVRQGGNRYTGYNWETNYSNAGEDWLNSSDTNIGDITDGPAAAAQKLSKNCTEYNVPYKLTTLQMAGYVAADKNGSVSEAEAAPSARWNEVKFQKDGELSMTPDLEDGVVYMDEYVNYLVQTLGDATTATGIQGYSLDNEPVLWNDTHPYLHGAEVSNSELVSKSIELASVVKRIDPNAEVFGPAFWGMLPCIQAGNGDSYTDPDWEAVKGNYNWYLDYYLDQMAQAEEEQGQRLLDVIDVHYYAQDCSTDEARMQAARSLYDPDYKENSWLHPYFSQYFPFLVRIQESIEQYYPGTKLAISEYNLGNIADEKNTGKAVSSAIAEADALGCFADNNVYLATYWGTLPECPYVESAINLYTNYDGKGSAFGDTLVEASTEDLSLAYAYAAIDAGDDSTVTTVLSNKSTTQTENAVITLDGSTTEYQSAVVYAITAEDDQIRIIDVQNDVSGNQVTVSLPPMSVAQVVIADEKSDETIYEAPDMETKEVVYNYNELELSENGFPMIPLEDLEHLKEIIINTTATCSSGASWYGGGGALTFNNLISESGQSFWGAKAFQFSAGTSDAVIQFDGYFTDGDQNEVQATVGDTYTELQPEWWKSSENDEKGTDVSVTYNTITFVYEYDNSSSGGDTTTTETTTTTTETTTETTTTTASSETTTEMTTTSSGNGETFYGDINLDGKVDLLDVVTINKALASIITLTEIQTGNADVFYDGRVDDQDAALLMQYVAFIVKELPQTA